MQLLGRCGFMLMILFVQKSMASESINEVYLEQLLANLNTTVDPCENFFQFACGNWARNYESAEYVDMPGYMDHKVNKQFLNILQEHKHETGIYEKLWHNYESCEQLKTPALNHYLRAVQEELNFQWPIFREDWNKPWQNETTFDWLSIIAGLRAYGLNGVFITQNINVRLTNGSHYLLELHQHQPRLLVLPRNDVANIFVNFGMSAEQSENVTSRVMALEEQLYNFTLINLKINSAEEDIKYKENYKEVTMKQLMTLAPYVDWKKYFDIVLQSQITNTLTDQELIQVFALNFDYFAELKETLRNTSNETIGYYIMLKFMYLLNEDLPNVKDKSIRCIKHLRGYMPLAMNYIYEQHVYKNQRKVTDAVLQEMYKKLRLTFEKIVAENHLNLNQTEQAYILAELRTMRMKIGNIPAQLTQQFVENYYQDINFNVSNFYTNHLQLLKLGTQKTLTKLQNLPALPFEQHFYEHDAETSSSSSPVKIFDNAVLLPYGYLQLPIFHYELTPLFRYSQFGFMLAYEIIHAFDFFHIVYDEHGVYNDLGVAVSQHFWQYLDCFNQNPSDSLSENIADVAGLRLVYQTFFEDVLNNLNTEFEFTSTNFTTQQLFFMNSVQFLCADMVKISGMDVKSLNLEHDMHNVRVQQNWAQFKPFAEAFNCAPGTSMNPTQKCRLW